MATVLNVALLAAGLAQHSMTRTHSSALAVILLAASVLAGLTVVARAGRTSISGSFFINVLAYSLAGPMLAVTTVVAAEGIAAIRLRSPVRFVATNLFAAMLPALLAANVLHAIDASAHGDAAFYGYAALAAAVSLCLNFGLVASFMWIHLGRPPLTPRVFLEYLPSQALTIALALVTAGVYFKAGLAGLTLAVAGLLAFSYMAQLLEQSRQRAQQYASLSWGVLGGLMRSLDVRDAHAARHAAAVAAFARDIAQAAGFDARDCELAHTAGLLHDIGRFALSDRVAERGRELTEEDWAAIHRHPELGADLLKDLGMYGPVAETVLAHHERVDGLGYPHGLAGDQIPELSKIVAVAEVYDTLTAKDTYRTPMSSFEALRELRRVAGSQLDAGYVEIFATLLGREDFAYRHRDAADFDAELGIERRIGEAAAGG